MEVVYVFAGIIGLIINVVLITNFIGLCRDVQRIADKIDELDSVVVKKSNPSEPSNNWDEVAVDSQDYTVIAETDASESSDTSDTSESSDSSDSSDNWGSFILKVIVVIIFFVLLVALPYFFK